jgi:hypothetical protein
MKDDSSWLGYCCGLAFWAGLFFGLEAAFWTFAVSASSCVVVMFAAHLLGGLWRLARRGRRRPSSPRDMKTEAYREKLAWIDSLPLPEDERRDMKTAAEAEYLRGL